MRSELKEEAISGKSNVVRELGGREGGDKDEYDTLTQWRMWVPVSNVCSHCMPSSCLVTVGHRTRQTTDTRVHPRRRGRRVGYSATPTRPQRFDGENSGGETRHRTNTPRLIRSCVMQMAVTKDARTASGNRYGVASCSP